MAPRTHFLADLAPPRLLIHLQRDAMLRAGWLLFFLSCWPGLALLAAEPEEQPIGESAFVISPQDGVSVELCTGLPPAEEWPAEVVSAEERFRYPAMGFFRLPLRYNDEGVRDDRPNPFLLRATVEVTFEPGCYQILLRSRRAARLWVNGKIQAENGFPPKISDGHDSVERPFLKLPPGVRFAAPGDQEVLTTIESNGEPLRFVLESIVGGFAGQHALRPELGETLVAYAPPQAEMFYLLGSDPPIPLDHEGWNRYHQECGAFLDQLDRDRRRRAQSLTAGYWERRHEYARRSLPAEAKLSAAEAIARIDRTLTADTSLRDLDEGHELAFLRRVYLDSLGVVPTVDEIADYLAAAETPPARAELLIDKILDDDRWADHWVSYWQDVLAENPSIVNPTLNNSGPFRWWIHESFLDNKPFDRFVTELVMMSGSLRNGGPAGFSMATENDAPFAAKANILASAFLGIQTKCARCHDAPYHASTQADLFAVAAMLNNGPLAVPETSSVPPDKLHALGREPLIEVSLKPGTPVPATWPWSEIVPDRIPDPFHCETDTPRARLSWYLTSPHNRRFASVVANRIWARLFGTGLVDSLDDWEGVRPTEPRLLALLTDQLIYSGYDVKHLTRIILKSQHYRRPQPEAPEFATPRHRRMTAEQLVDSLFVAFGKPLRTEQINIDLTGGRPWKSALNLGYPTRAWQFAGMATNRDRPSLTLPRAQAVLDVLVAFGWRASRQEPVSERSESPNVIQPAILSNGTLSRWLTTLTDDHALTELCLQDQTLDRLVDQLFLWILTREPTAAERSEVMSMLREGFGERRTGAGSPVTAPPEEPRPFVTWANHLDPAATPIKLAEAEAARQGDPPTRRLTSSWRERMEDVLWTLLNLPETIHY